MAVTEPLAVPEQLPGRLGQDPRAEQSILAATHAVRAYCRWHVAPVVTETVKLDGLGGDFLSLPSLRVRAITAVRSDGLDVPSAGWRWSASLGTVLAVQGAWSPYYAGIEVDLEHGYELEEVADVVQIVLTAAARDLVSPLGYIREQVGSTSTAPSLVAPNVAGGVHLMDHERADLAPYRIVL